MESVKKWLQDRTAKKNGLYVHYTPPKLVGVVAAAQLRQWARGGAVTRLERAVLAGQGHRLLSEAEALPMSSHLPALVAKCDALHSAVEKGSLLELQGLLEPDYNRRKFVSCQDEAGTGLLHKAVYFDFMDIAQYLVANYPNLVHQKDSEGRTALHYAALCRDEAAAAALLEGAGAARGARDAHGRTPGYYRGQARAHLALPSPPADVARETMKNQTGLVIKQHNIRIWCHDCDMSKLQRVVWEGHGARLMREVSNQPVVKRFLEAVPYIMNTIRQIHVDVIENNLETLMKHSGDPVPPAILSSRDKKNMTVMHKAAGLGHGGILRYLTGRYPQGINDADKDGRTPLHYAAAVKDDHHIYQTLVGLGADESAVDIKNKTPGYYIKRPQEIDASVLKNLPDAPRTPSSAYPPSWDWKILDNEAVVEPYKKPRKKNNVRKSDENISTKNNSKSVSESTQDYRTGGMKSSSTHEIIKSLPELDDGITFINKSTEDLSNNMDSEVVEEIDFKTEKILEQAPEGNKTEEITLVPKNQNEKSEINNATTHSDEAVGDSHEITSVEGIVTIKQSDIDDETEIHLGNIENGEDLNTIDNPVSQNEHESVENNESKLDNSTDNIIIEDENTAMDETENNEQNNEPKDFPSNTENEENEDSKDALIGDHKPNDKSEDDDDVQVQGETPSEYSVSNMRSTAEASVIGSANRGYQFNGLDTQENLIEGHLSGEAETDTQDASIDQAETLVDADVLVVDSDTDPEITELISSENMEMLAALVLNGEGSRLVGRTSGNQELQAFLENVPTYMKKIKQVHLAAKDGNIKELQTSLDRRKFAIARDLITPNGATPLHVATVFGKTNIVKYLGGRFPETLSAVDFEGRTALHYAAVLPDNGHFYNLIQLLGANAKDLDDNGRSAEDYFKDPSLLPFEQLFSDFGVSEESVQNMLSDKGSTLAANGHMDIPIFKTEEGRYLAKSLGDPLIKGLTEVANVKPKDPVAFLASFLHNFPDQEKLRLGTQETSVIMTKEAPEVENEQPPPKQPALNESLAPPKPIDVITLEPQHEVSPDAPEAAFSSVNRDEHGQSMLHFAAARSHTRNALFDLLQESNINLGYRDELYRTARDVSIQANVPDNTAEIDRWVIHIAARGNSEMLMELLLEGYDHILDIVDEEGVPISDIVAQRGNNEMSNLLASIPGFEESRESLHSAIRRGDLQTVKKALSAEGGRTLARGKNTFGRTALHVAVLAQHEELVAYLAEHGPELLRVGDNLERTPLHYAMGIDKIESISRVLIRAGAKRVLKDLKGRQPSYYFMNKSDILRLKEEEEVY